jgi:DNA-binding NarL/FixJ family response regulator
MAVPFPAHILIADDHVVVREGLRAVLEREPDLRVVAQAADGAQAVEHALSTDVHLAILDIAMPRMTGLQAARELGRRRPELRTLILSM